MCGKISQIAGTGRENSNLGKYKVIFLLLGGLSLIATDFPKPVRDVESFIETNHIMLGISATLRN